MMYLLIDTSLKYPTVSIIEDDKVLYLFHEEINSDMSSKIMPIIDEGFKSINKKIEDIDKIFVVNGPGSFTGIRIGVTIAKTIAWALKKEIVTISSLEFMATTDVGTKYIVPIIDARRGNVFSGIYDKDLNIIKEDKLINLENLKKSIDSNYTIVSYESNNVKVDVLKIINKHKNDRSLNPHSVNPNYLKLTEAEESRLKND